MVSHFDIKAFFFLITLYLSGLILGHASYAQEAECDCKKNQQVELAAIGQGIEKQTRTPAETDPRKYFADLEKDEAVREMWPNASLKKLNAVVTVGCGDGSSSGILICDGKTIVTSAHTVIDSMGQVRWDPKSQDKNKDCFVVAENSNGKQMDYNLELPSREEFKERVGTMYPNTTDQTATDWAVLTIAGNGIPKDMATPLKIGQLQSTEQFKDLPLLYTVSSFADLERKRAYTICTGQDVVLQNSAQYSESQPYINTGCRTYKGGSGGAYSTFKKGNKDPLVVCIASEIRSKEGGSRCVPIQGKLLETIKKLSKEKGCIVPLDGPSKQASL